MEQDDDSVETERIGGDITAAEAAVYSYRPSAEPRPTVVDGGRIVVPAELHESGFFDPHAPEDPPEILLNRVLVARSTDVPDSWIGRLTKRIGDIMSDPEREAFRMLKPIGYVDRKADQVILVPADLATFKTDLTSVPRLFTWLIPKTGVHLPAALLHDGLVHNPDEPRSYIADSVIPREESDRIFRDGMRDLGASWLRRWLVWATVMLATLVGGNNKTRWVLAALVTFGTILALGTLATIDLFDCREPFPWMADRPWWAELATGGAAAAIITSGLSLFWWSTGAPGRLLAYGASAAAALLIWILTSGNVRIALLAALLVLIGMASVSHRTDRVGLIAGLALSLLYHVTLAVAIVFGVFTVLEAVADRRWDRFAIAGSATGLIVAVLVVIGLAAC